MDQGINLAGPAFAPENLPGRTGYDFKFPTPAMLKYYRNIGFTAVRLSILWERLQPQLMDQLDQSYVDQIRQTVQLASGNGMHVVIDLHNYARYRGQVIGTSQVPNDAFRDIWRRLASALSDMPAISGWGLMNEPYNTNGAWAQTAQWGVDGIREVDRIRTIYVGGDSFSSAERWPKVHPQPFVHDPMGNVVYEAHIYLDPDASGKYNVLLPTETQAPVTTAERRMRPFVDWLRQHGQRGMIGEYGVPASEAAWFDGVGTLLDVAEKECMSTFVWAGGAWSPNYKLSLEPVEFEDKPLAAWFRKRLAPAGAKTP